MVKTKSANIKVGLEFPCVKRDYELALSNNL